MGLHVLFRGKYARILFSDISILNKSTQKKKKISSLSFVALRSCVFGSGDWKILGEWLKAAKQNSNIHLLTEYILIYIFMSGWHNFQASPKCTLTLRTTSFRFFFRVSRYIVCSFSISHLDHDVKVVAYELCIPITLILYL